MNSLLLSAECILLAVFTASGLQQVHHVNRDAVRYSGTKLAFLQDGAIQSLQHERTVCNGGSHYFDPITGESLCWDDLNDARRKGPSSRRAKKSRIPLPMMETPKLDGGCDDSNYFFDPITGESQCWFM